MRGATDLKGEANMSAVERHGVTVSVQRWHSHKLPILAVEIDGEVYKVASFNSETTAKWFEGVMEEFFEGLVAKT